MPIRVALVDLPQLMSEIVQNILDRNGDIAVVAEHEEADVVILAADGDDLPSAGRIRLARRPTAKVIAIEERGRTASLYQLRLQRTPLGEASAGDLLAAIRTGSADWG